jgi:predicted Fe-Mo cluster-binding NifX family protein
MKVAITVWRNRISPVFDVARNIIILDVEKGKVLQERSESFSNDQPEHKAVRLQQLMVKTLICGAISKLQAHQISSHQIELIPFISGEIEDVIKAFLSGNLPNSKLMMPGCCRSRGNIMCGRKKQKREGQGKTNA